MRRRDYEESEREEMERVLMAAGHGFLGVTRPDGWPSVVPLNFVYADGRVYYHGAREGEKMDAVGGDDRVTFLVVEAFSLVPSYFRDPRLACPATQYYKSVVIRGRARVVREPEEKARALQALMEKLQPEGGYEAISAADPLYRKSIATTAVVAIEIDEMTGKFKFGQNLSSAKREAVAGQLEARGGPGDVATAEEMRRRGRQKAVSSRQ